MKDREPFFTSQQRFLLLLWTIIVVGTATIILGSIYLYKN